MGAVDECQTLLGGELDGCEAGAPQRLATVELFAGEARGALAAEHDRDVGERGEVSRGADRAAARHDRQHVALEQAE